MRHIFAIGLMMFGTAAVSQTFNAEILPPWDGIAVPDGQQCSLFGGNGATPAFDISNLPDATRTIHIEFNDLSFPPLAENGGHGTIGFDASGEAMRLASVPGLTDDLPAGIFVVRAARSSGQYASDGYLPPCSGGRGNDYSADIIALDGNGNRLGFVTVPIGRY